MAITYPFDFEERHNNSSKITLEQEVETWVNLEHTLGDLVSKCNEANGTSIQIAELIDQEKKNGALTADEYDENITKIETCLNQIIVASEPQGLNPTNTISLFKRGDYVNPFLIWQRDTNLRTIQTVINSIYKMYSWSTIIAPNWYRAFVEQCPSVSLVFVEEYDEENSLNLSYDTSNYEILEGQVYEIME